MITGPQKFTFGNAFFLNRAKKHQEKVMTKILLRAPHTVMINERKTCGRFKMKKKTLMVMDQ